jgi:ribosomal silencing factor RsfS
MSDGISFISDDKIEKDIKKILSQTNYTEEIAKEKLKQFNYDFMSVLKDYMGITNKKENKSVNSINQEIYRQFRYNLDSSMRQYRESHPIDLEQVVTNLKESDEREKIKLTN